MITNMQSNATVLDFAKEIPETYDVPSFRGAYYALITVKEV